MVKSQRNRSLQGVYNLAGFITTASGQKVAFVQYLSGYAVEPADQRNRRIPLVRFEAGCIKICTRTTKTKGPHQMRPFLIQRSQD